MKSISDVLVEMAERKSLTPRQQSIASELYEIARIWQAGDIALSDAESMAYDGYVRFKVIMATSPTSKDYPPLRALLDALARSGDLGGVWTKHGYLSGEEIASHNGKIINVINKATGEFEDVAIFPVSYMRMQDGTIDHNAPIYATSGQPAKNLIRFERPEPKPSKYAEQWLG